MPGARGGRCGTSQGGGSRPYWTYSRDSDNAAAWKKFFAVSAAVPSGEEPVAPTGQAEEPVGPPPGQEANGAYMMGHLLRPTTRYEPDIDALKAASTRIVVAGGTDETGALAHRTAAGLAERLGQPLAGFPGGHVGFISDPEAFAGVLRTHLTEG